MPTTGTHARPRRGSRKRYPNHGTDDFLFEGDITDYWSPAVIRHWVLHIPGVTPTALRLYLLLRAMLTSSPHGLRRMTTDQLCYLLTEEDEKPVGESTVRKALALLAKKRLVVNPDGERLVTSTGRGGIQTSARRYKVIDLPPDEHTGWSNTWQKLDAYREDWRESPVTPPTHTRTDVGIVRSFSSGRTDQEQQPDSLPEDEETPGQIERSKTSGARSLKSDPGSKTSGARSLKSGATAPVSGNAGGIQSFSQAHTRSLSPAGGPGVLPVTVAEDREDEREKPTAKTTTKVPRQRSGAHDQAEQDDAIREAHAFASRLPGVSDGEAHDLAPLVADARTRGWTAQALHAHLTSRCDTSRVSYPAAVYLKHLKGLGDPSEVAAPRGAGQCRLHPALKADDCWKCRSVLAVDRDPSKPARTTGMPAEVAEQLAELFGRREGPGG